MELITLTKAKTKQEFLRVLHRRKSQVEQLELPDKQRRNAELIVMLEVASAKLDRFGWSRIDDTVKDELCSGWCRVLSQYDLQEVRDGIDAVFSHAKGNLRSINEHQVAAKIQKARNDFLKTLPNEPEPERNKPRVSAEAASKILSELGFKMGPNGREKARKADETSN